MRPVTVTEVADELYALPPAEFTAARDERARQVRAAGQRDDAAQIRKLARPTASAWLINQLARDAPAELARLASVGEALEAAQRSLAGDRLRELSGERRQVVSELLPRAAQIASRAGQPASAAVLGEVRATLEAAVADARARSEVRSGRLTRALAYAGIGEVDLAAALAVPAGTAPASSARPRGERRDSAAAQSARPAADALQAAQRAADESERALAEADQRLAVVEEQRQFARRRIEHLERELRQARREDSDLASAAQQARRDRDDAARQRDSARRDLGRARRQGGGR